MRKLLGLLLVMGGLAVAVLWAPAQDSEEHLATVAEIADPGGGRARAHGGEPPGAATRTFSPQRPLARRQEAIPGVAGQPQVGQGLVPRETEYVVTTAASPEPVAPAVRGERLRSVTPTDVMARAGLVRDLQRELRRVGCYSGAMSGVWSPASKRAMSAFTERVNASLPVEEPDYVLLSLLKSQPGLVCGSTCPPGQVSVGGGQCQPRAVLARAGRSPKQVAGIEGEHGMPAGRDALPGRMAVGAGQPDTAAPPVLRSRGRADANARMAAANPPEETEHAPNSLTVPPRVAKKGPRAGPPHSASHRERARAERHRRVIVMYRRPMRYLAPFYGRPPGFYW